MQARGLRYLGLMAVLWVSYAAALQPIPELGSHRVVDLTATLTPEQKTSLTKRLRDFEQRRGTQIAVLLVDTTRPETIEQYSIRVVEQWPIGRGGRDDGVLLLVAKDDRTLRIEVGYGLEGVIPDALAKRIISEIITPYFRQGDYYGGLAAGVDSLIRLASGQKLLLPKVKPQSRHTITTEKPIVPYDEPVYPSTGLLITIIGIGAFIILLFWWLQARFGWFSGTSRDEDDDEDDDEYVSYSSHSDDDDHDDFKPGGGRFGGGGASGSW
jgi:uncharacterized protein